MDIADIRFWIFDRTPADNPLEKDLEFTDEEIERAMLHAVRAFNALPPHTVFVSMDNLPKGTNMMFEATAEMLYKMKLHSLGRNHFEYDAGNVKVDDSGPKIAFLQAMIKEVGESWRRDAQALKVGTNIRRFYQRIQ